MGEIYREEVDMFETSHQLPLTQALRIFLKHARAVAWPNLMPSLHLMVFTRRNLQCRSKQSNSGSFSRSSWPIISGQYRLSFLFATYLPIAIFVFPWHLPKCKHGSIVLLLFTLCIYDLKSIIQYCLRILYDHTTIHTHTLGNCGLIRSARLIFSC